MAQIDFHKMQGLGNDFIVLDQKRCPDFNVTAEWAQRASDRRFGIGCDQVLWLVKPTERDCDFWMRVFNADGSEAETCGNGLRAAAVFWDRFYPHAHHGYRIQTLGGITQAWVTGLKVKVDLGVPEVKSPMTVLKVKDRAFLGQEINVGNPHYVLEPLQELKGQRESWGPSLEHHSHFANRSNIEFLRVLDSHHIELEVWERGSGATLACGTGGTAAGVAAIHQGWAKSPVQVTQPGGSIQVEWQGLGQPVMMTGPAEFVFEGRISS